MSLESIAAFMITSALLSIAPGPDNIFVLTQSALYGKNQDSLLRWVFVPARTGLENPCLCKHLVLAERI